MRIAVFISARPLLTSPSLSVVGALNPFGSTASKEIYSGEILQVMILRIYHGSDKPQDMSLGLFLAEGLGILGHYSICRQREALLSFWA